MEKCVELTMHMKSRNENGPWLRYLVAAFDQSMTACGLDCLSALFSGTPLTRYYSKHECMFKKCLTHNAYTFFTLERAVVQSNIFG